LILRTGQWLTVFQSIVSLVLALCRLELKIRVKTAERSEDRAVEFTRGARRRAVTLAVTLVE
jgi:hypothetical protein